MSIEIIIQICVIPLLGFLTKYIIDFLTAKRDQINANIKNELAQKYINLIHDTITKCVIATNQTYVDNLKKSGQFDAEAQKEAFRRTMEAVLAILGQDAIDYITEITGDIQTYLTELIEAEVNAQK